MFWWIVATTCAFFIKGLCGFANTLVFSTILGFTANNISISPIELMLGYPTNLILAWKERKSIKWKVCLPISILVILGNIPGIFILKNADSRIIKVIFGFVIVLVGAEMFLRETRKDGIKQSRIILMIIGLTSGVLCGLYGIGALLAAYIGRVTDSSSSFKANICIVFIIENTFRIILYSFMGIISVDVMKYVLILIPFMLLGLFLGMKSSRVLKEKIVKKSVIVMLILSGIGLIINNL